MAKKNDPFQHVPTVDPSEEWASGFEFFLRIRGIAVSIAIEVATSVALWEYLGLAAGIASVVVAVSLTTMLCWARHHILQSVKKDNQFHNVLHETRNLVAEFLKIDRRSKPKLKAKLEAFHQSIIEQLATFFRCCLNSPDINCALRLAEKVEGEPCYVTYARSSGLEASRNQQSKPLSADKGLAQALRNKETKGVFIINSISKAAEVGIWDLAPNDKLPDVQSLMVAPINSIENGDRVMIGILYVTARNPVFKKRHTLSLKAFADLLGLVYPILFARMNPKSTAP